MYLSIIFLPLFGSIVAGFFGRKVGVSGAQLITTSCVVIATVLAVLAFIEVGINNIPVDIHLFRWIDSEWLYISWGFHFDALTVVCVCLLLKIYTLCWWKSNCIWWFFSINFVHMTVFAINQVWRGGRRSFRFLGGRLSGSLLEVPH